MIRGRARMEHPRDLGEIYTPAGAAGGLHVKGATSAIRAVTCDDACWHDCRGAAQPGSTCQNQLHHSSDSPPPRGRPVGTCRRMLGRAAPPRPAPVLGGHCPGVQFPYPARRARHRRGALRPGDVLASGDKRLRPQVHHDMCRRVADSSNLSGKSAHRCWAASATGPPTGPPRGGARSAPRAAQSRAPARHHDQPHVKAAVTNSTGIARSCPP
jgi:hypothetical protein